jgi:hypothetical protein
MEVIRVRETSLWGSSVFLSSSRTLRTSRNSTLRRRILRPSQRARGNRRLTLALVPHGSQNGEESSSEKDTASDGNSSEDYAKYARQGLGLASTGVGLGLGAAKKTTGLAFGLARTLVRAPGSAAEYATGTANNPFSLIFSGEL